MKSFREFAGIVLAIPILAAMAVRGAAAQELAWTGAVQYSQGKYIFSETVRSWNLYSGLTWQGSRLRLSVGIPVVIQDSRALTFVGDLPLPTGGPDNGAVADRKKGEPVPMSGRRSGGGGAGSGGSIVTPVALQTTGTPVDSVEAPGSMAVELADPVLSAGVQLVPARGGFMGLDLMGSVKIPVRDLDSGVGTGEVDVGVGLSTAAGGRGVMFFADVSWWRYGDLPELELKDAVSYGVGIGKVLGGRVSGMLSLSGSTGVMDNVDPPLEVGTMLNIGLGDGKSVTLGAGAGLTESSPDISFSLGGRIRLAGL